MSSEERETMLGGFEQLRSYFALQCGDKGVEGGGEECNPGELGSGKVLAYLNEILFVGTNSNNYRVCLSTSLPLALVERDTLEEARAVARDEAASVPEEEAGRRESEEGEWDANILDVSDDLSLVICNREDLGKRRPAAQAVLEFAVRSWAGMIHVPFRRHVSHGSLLLANLHLPGAEEELNAALKVAIETLQKNRADDKLPTVLEHFTRVDKAEDGSCVSPAGAGAGETTLQVVFGGTVAVKGAGGAAEEKTFYPESLSADVDIARVVSSSPAACTFPVSLEEATHTPYREEGGLGLEVELELCLEEEAKERISGVLRARHRSAADEDSDDVKRVQEVAFHLVGSRPRQEEAATASREALLEYWATTDRLVVEKVEGGQEEALAEEESQEEAGGGHTVQAVQQAILRRQEQLQRQQLFLHFNGAAVHPDSGLDQAIGVNVELGRFFTRR